MGAKPIQRPAFAFAKTTRLRTTKRAVRVALDAGGGGRCLASPGLQNRPPEVRFSGPCAAPPVLSLRLFTSCAAKYGGGVTPWRDQGRGAEDRAACAAGARHRPRRAGRPRPGQPPPQLPVRAGPRAERRAPSAAAAGPCRCLLLLCTVRLGPR